LSRVVLTYMYGTRVLVWWLHRVVELASVGEEDAVCFAGAGQQWTL